MDQRCRILSGHSYVLPSYRYFWKRCVVSSGLIFRTISTVVNCLVKRSSFCLYHFQGSCLASLWTLFVIAFSLVWVGKSGLRGCMLFIHPRLQGLNRKWAILHFFRFALVAPFDLQCLQLMTNTFVFYCRLNIGHHRRWFHMRFGFGSIFIFDKISFGFVRIDVFQDSFC